MLRLLERNIAAIGDRMVLVAPPHRLVPASFTNRVYDRAFHAELVCQMQRLRGSVYLADGAIDPNHLSPDGLHQTPEDQKSWHLIILDRERRPSSCVWFMEHHQPQSIESLRVRSSPLNGADPRRAWLHRAIDAELTRARDAGLSYVEVGGWAVSPRSRCGSEGLLLALAAYSLGRLLGGAIGLTTATVRHASSTILRRLGGSHLEADGTSVTSYYDDNYKCDMELLRFDSRHPNPNYSGLIDVLKDRLAQVPVHIGERHRVAAA